MSRLSKVSKDQVKARCRLNQSEVKIRSDQASSRSQDKIRSRSDQRHVTVMSDEVRSKSGQGQISKVQVR